MIDLLARKLATQASSNAANALKTAATTAAVPTLNGAVGDGQSASADQSGWQATLDYIAASASAAPTGSWDNASYATGAMIEPGIYDVGGLTQLPVGAALALAAM